MKEVNVALWEVEPEEVKTLPRNTQLIEYCTITGRMKIKRTGAGCLYDFFSCVYLLAAPTKGKEQA